MSNAADRPICAATRTDGQPCQAFARPGRPFCAAHDPEHAEAMRAIRSAGGQARSTPAPAEPIKLGTIAEQLQALETTIDRVRAGAESVGVARLVLYGISLARPLVELGDLEERLAALEAAMGGEDGTNTR